MCLEKIPLEVVALDASSDGPLALALSDGRRVRTRTAVIASGARYRRPDIPHLKELENRGVWYWASPIEARLCRNEEIVLVGGGNSAGQAAVFLRDFAAKVWMLVRGPSLAESMSRYLIDRIEATENIEVLSRSRSNRACRASSRWVTCAAARSNASAGRSAKVPPWCRNSMPFSPRPLVPRGPRRPAGPRTPPNGVFSRALIAACPAAQTRTHGLPTVERVLDKPRRPRTIPSQ